MDLVVSKTIMLDSLGWQKLDITSIVQKWYNKNSRHRIRHGNHRQGKNHPREKLTLLVDCAGCSNSIIPITFSQSNATTPRDSAGDSSNIQSPEENRNDSSVVGGEDELENEIPFLVIETETAANSRRNRRRAQECGKSVLTAKFLL